MNVETSLPFTAASFNHYLSQGQLMASRCTGCGALHLPPRAICPRCYSESLVWEKLSGTGHLAAFTEVYIGPTFMNAEGFGRKNPYLTGIVELAEGVRISARLLGFETLPAGKVPIGAPLQVEFLPLGEGEQTRFQLAFRAAG